ncbi:hypothetical protein [Lachnospira multipara]|nr:hypothetical protein [Lachnospira multipara]
MLSLYNAINATSYDNLDDVIVTELEDAINKAINECIDEEIIDEIKESE